MGGKPIRKSFLLVFVLALICSYTSVGFSGSAGFSIVFTQIPIVQSEQKFDKRFNFQSPPPEQCRIVSLTPAKPDGELKLLTEEFYSACDPCVSFDGKKLLFAARRSPGEEWNIWEMEISGINPRKLTDGLGDCREPVYLAKSSITPPEFDEKVRWIAFTSTAAGTYDESGEEKATSIYTTNIEPISGRGTVVWRNTFNLSHDFSPTVLEDGRILFSSWQHRGIRYFPHGKIALMTTNWAGTGLNLFYGNHQGEPVKSMACEMSDRTLVFVESDGSSYDGSGQLASVSFRRPLHSHRVLSNGKGRYRTPHAFPDGRLAVSYSSGEQNYGVYFFDYDKRMAKDVVYDHPGWDEIDAIPVVSRDEPMGRITIVVDSKETGHLQCLNVYDSDRPEAASIEKGRVKRVRFVEGLPLSSQKQSSLARSTERAFESNPSPLAATCLSGTRVLGEAPVEADGSFLVELPADTPFFIQTLDENGMALQTMRGWMWVRRGSRRGCVGCHENKELSPENRTTDALRKATPVSLTAPPEERRSVDFKHDVVPVVERRCLNCHGNPSPDGGLYLGKNSSGDYFEAFERLLTPDPGNNPYEVNATVYPGSSRRSRLIGLLFGSENNSPAGKTSHGGLLTEEEMRLMVEWIDLGAHWDNAYIMDD